MPKKPVLAAICTLVGFTIGAGILGIPFAVAKAGYFTGLLIIMLLGLFILTLNLCLGEVTQRTKGIHQLAGYAKIYLGRKGYYLMLVVFTLFSYGALIAYIVKIGEFLGAVFIPILGGNEITYSIVFFIFAFIIIYKGLSLVEKSETWMVVVMLALILIITMIALPKASIENLKGLDIKSFFVPYGVVLFAFAALPAIPSLNEELRKDRKELKKVIIIGSLVPIIFYTVFATIVIAVSGLETTDGGIIGLAKYAGDKVLILGSIFGILTMATSFIAVAFAMKEMFHYDYKLKERSSSTFACIIHLIVAVVLLDSGIKDLFFRILDITGTFGGSLEGILVVLIWLSAKKLGKRRPEYKISCPYLISIVLILMFLLGTVFEVISWL